MSGSALTDPFAIQVMSVGEVPSDGFVELRYRVLVREELW